MSRNLKRKYDGFGNARLDDMEAIVEVHNEDVPGVDGAGGRQDGAEPVLNVDVPVRQGDDNVNPVDDDDNPKSLQDYFKEMEKLRNKFCLVVILLLKLFRLN